LEDSEKGKVEVEVQFQPGDNILMNASGLKRSDEQHEFLLQANRYKGILDYRNLMRTYLIDTLKLNLFKLLVESVLQRTKNPETNKFFGLEWEELQGKRKKLPAGKGDYGQKRDLEAELTRFSKGLRTTLDKIEPDVNRLMQRFDPLMDVKFQFQKVRLTENRGFGGNVIGLEVEYNGRPIQNHHEFFNEARLSALGISIFLASYLYHFNEDEYQKAYKLLLLDDIFIGMDMGNRLPMLEILAEDFSAYQIVMTTYDRQWYEMAKFHLGKSKWKFLEFYVDAETSKHPRTQIVDGDDSDYLSKAWHYFRQKDYAACANYQRRAFEEKVKALLPASLHYAFNEDGSLNNDLKHATYFQRLLDFLTNNGLDASPFEKYKLYSKIVLNPLSHDFAGLQIYRGEVLSVFGILEAFKNIQKQELIKCTEKSAPTLELMLYDIEGERHSYKVRLLENLICLRQGDKLTYYPCGCKIISCKHGTSERQDVEDGEEATLNEMCQILHEQHGVEPNGDYTTLFKRNNGGATIKEMASAG
jgi:hypothetical protein